MSINIEELKTEALTNLKICMVINDSCKCAKLLEDIKEHKPQEFTTKPINYRKIDFKI